MIQTGILIELSERAFNIYFWVLENNLWVNVQTEEVVDHMIRKDIVQQDPVILHNRVHIGFLLDALQGESEFSSQWLVYHNIWHRIHVRVSRKDWAGWPEYCTADTKVSGPN